MVCCGWDHRLHYNRTKWIHKGQAKIKMYKIKIMVQTIYIKCSFPRDSTPYILPSKGEIVPPISTKINWNTKTLSFRKQYWLIGSPSIQNQKHSASKQYWLPQLQGLDRINIHWEIGHIQFIQVNTNVQTVRDVELNEHSDPHEETTLYQGVRNGSTKVGAQFIVIIEETHWDHKINMT